MKSPSVLETLGRLIGNIVLSSILYFIFMNILGARTLFIAGFPSSSMYFMNVFLHMLPGSAILFTLLWRWLAKTGFLGKFNWGAAFTYGVIIGIVNVPIAAALLCWREQMSPMTGFLFGTLALLLSPKFLLLGIITGICLGATNGTSAAAWSQTKRD